MQPKSLTSPIVRQDAIVFTNGLLAENHAKTCHGLLRGSDRFAVRAVIDHQHAGQDAGEVMDGWRLDIPVFPSLAAFLDQAADVPRFFLLGVAFPGGYLPDSARGEITNAIRKGLAVVSGLHHLLSEDEELSQLAAQYNTELIDIRKPRKAADMQFWTGDIYKVRAPRVSVLGIDCAVGKRTTCQMLLRACRQSGLKTEMIYTGQTGWMQGYPYGFIFDTTPNDFVSGELERAIVNCDLERAPDLILIEGQSSLRNPSGPCGSELLLSAAAAGAILQHVPGRKFGLDLEDVGVLLPDIEQEIDLIRAYGVSTLAVTLNGEGLDAEGLGAAQEELQKKLNLPVARPLEEGVEALVPLLREVVES